MISKSLEELMNEQVEKEAFSSNLYLSMASWAENQGFEGIADWFYAQAEEERMHMLKFVRYINERGGKAIVPALEKPEADFPNVKFIFDESLKHEKYITGEINNIFKAAVEENDYAAQNWLQWFIAEQFEEETSVQRIIDKLNIMGDHNMYIFDRDIMSMRGEEHGEQ